MSTPEHPRDADPDARDSVDEVLGVPTALSSTLAALVAALVLAIAGVVAVPMLLDLPEALRRAEAAERGGQVQRFATHTRRLLVAVQVERGQTNRWLHGPSRGDADPPGEVWRARNLTDAAGRSWLDAADTTPPEVRAEAGAATVADALGGLPALRAAADSRDRTADEIFDRYTAVVAGLLAAAQPAAGARATRTDAAYRALLDVVEQLARERGEVAGLLDAPGDNSVALRVAVVGHRSARERLRALAGSVSDDALVRQLADSESDPTFRRFAAAETVVAASTPGGPQVDSGEWFGLATALLDRDERILLALSDALVARAEREARSERERAGRLLLSGALTLAAGAVVASAVVIGHRLRRRRAAEARERREAELLIRLQRIFATGSSGILISDAGGRIESTNPVLDAMFGHPPGHLVGRGIAVLMSHEDAVRHPRFLRQRISGGDLQRGGSMREVWAVRADGERFPISIMVMRVRVGAGTHLVAVITDVSERFELNRRLNEQAVQLRDSVEALARSNAELEQFAYAAAHDLQEPLRKVTSYLGLLVEDYGDVLDEEGRQYVGRATDSASRMRTLITDLLAVSRLRPDTMRVQGCDTAALVRDVLDDLEAVIREAGVTVVVGELPTVLADPAHMRQVFVNLISNAVKYHAPGGPRVEVWAERSGDGWQFTVRDNGIGFRQEHADRIFGMFQRLVGRSQYPGTGIGLAVVAKVVGNHGGRIWATSEPGAGATFRFTLPAGTAPEEARVPAPRAGTVDPAVPAP